MISFSSITSASAAAEYYSGLDKAAEYYGNAGRVPSRWLGTGAQIQNLHGEVGRAALRAQLSGAVHDRDGTARQLGIQRAGEFQHRAGWDLTVSAPKSVSLEALVNGRADVDNAHRKAVNAVVDYLERHAATARINGQFVATGNLTVAAYDHVSSRSGDPQLHTHLLIANGARELVAQGGAADFAAQVLDLRAGAEPAAGNLAAVVVFGRLFEIRVVVRRGAGIRDSREGNHDAPPLPLAARSIFEARRWNASSRAALFGMLLI